jgi:ribokinase
MAGSQSESTGTAGGRVCVVGSLNMDLIVRAPCLPTPGQTLLGGELLTLPGGKGANQAVAAARAGSSVSMIGAVGDDDYGRQLVDAVGGDGVDVSGVRHRRGVATGVGVIIVASDHGGENMIVVAGGANLTLSPQDVRDSGRMLESADVLLMQLESPLEALVEAATLAQRVGRTVVLNAAPARHIPAALLDHVDVLVVNRSEAAALTGLPESSEPAELLQGALALGPREVVLTLGAQGAIARIGRVVLRAPPFEVRSVDTVAAGDAFVGTLAACLSCIPPERRINENTLGTALTLASAAGALATTRHGAIPSLPTLAEVRDLAASRPECAARMV